MGSFYTDKVARLVARKGSQKHRFGGSPIHRFEGKAAKSLHVHCLYLLNMDDPVLPSLLPNVKWLPLYYPLFNNACDFSYQVVSDDVVRVLEVSRKFTHDFPDEDFPQVLPQHPIKAIPISYEEQKTLVYAYTVNSIHTFGGKLSSADKSLVKRFGYPFSQLGGIQEMMQGPPRHACPNKECEYANESWVFEIFGVVWNNPVPGFTIWGEGMDDAQTIFQICAKCKTIHVCNRCTQMG